MPQPSSSASTPAASPATKVKPGSNWKKLSKTLNRSSSNDSLRRTAGGLKRSASLNSGNHAKKLRQIPIDVKGKGRAREGDDEAVEAPARTSTGTGSPAPTSLPWFADDLSPEDLALVSTGNATIDRSLSVSSAIAELKGQGSVTELSYDEMRRKKRLILGGIEEETVSTMGGSVRVAIAEERKKPGTYLGIDCEMVGVGPNGSESILARVSIVNWHGYTVLDRFVKPKERVTDYRTWVSGIRPQDLKHAPSFDEVQKEVAALIKGKVLVGHAIHNDLKALLLEHPRSLIRDTASYPPLRELAKTKFPALRKLAKLCLGIEIQTKGEEHNSVEDARATMAIYRTQHEAWQVHLGRAQGAGGARRGKKRGKGVTQEDGEEEETQGRSRRKDVEDAERGAVKGKGRDSSGSEWWTALG